MNTKTAPKFTLSTVRKLYAELTTSELCDFKSILSSRYVDNESDLKALVKSLQERLITVDEFLKGDFISENNRYYSSNDYVVTREGDIVHADEVQFCDYFQEYTSDDVYTIYTGRHTERYCQDAMDDVEHYEYDGNYYTLRGLEYHELVICSDGTILHNSEAYYDEDSGEYQTEPIQTYIREYHSDTSVNFVDFTENPSFYIGFELEKEDKEVKESILIKDFERTCKLWRKEKDGSLDDSTGFELISPAFELVPERIKEAIESNPTLLSHVNASTNTKTCGGHVNVSVKGVNGSELFDRLKGYTPLFYALYFKRVDKGYSKGKSNSDLKKDSEKYQAIRIHRNHLEYRIISAVPNVSTLIWRAELFRLILSNPTDCPKVAFFNVQTILKEHLSVMYPTSNRFEKLNNRLIEYTKRFEDIDLLTTKND